MSTDMVIDINSKPEDTKEVRPNSWQSNLPRLDLVEYFPLPGPLTVWVETTDFCNFKCHFCPESLPDFKEQSQGGHMMSMEKFRRVADELAAVRSVKKVQFYIMGEPFLNKKLLEMVCYARQVMPEVRLYVTSNGSLVTAEKYRLICASGLNHLKISIYGTSEQSHQRNTGSRSSLEQIRNNVLGLKTFRDENAFKTPVIYVKTITKSKEENERFLEMFTGVGDEISVQHWTNWNDQVKDYAPVPKEAMLATERFQHVKEVCPFPFHVAAIHSDLKVSVCNVDWNKKAVIGDLNTETLGEIWRGKKLRGFQLAHVRRRRCELDACKHCTFIHTAVDNVDRLTEQFFMERLQ